MKISLCFLFMMFIFSSCGDSDFKKIENLNEFRVLAIEADRPEANPGDVVNMRLFVTDAGEDSGRVIDSVVSLCSDPGIAYGANISCDHDPEKVETTLQINTSDPDFFNNKFTGFSNTIAVNIPANFLDEKNDLEKTNGISYIAIFEFDIDNKKLKFFKRISVTSRALLNSNPSGSEIELNGDIFSTSVKKGDKLLLSAQTPETYSYINVDGSLETKKENYSVAWYISEGEVNLAKTNVSEATEIEKLPDSSFVIVAIIRDERGGVEVIREIIP